MINKHSQELLSSDIIFNDKSVNDTNTYNISTKLQMPHDIRYKPLLDSWQRHVHWLLVKKENTAQNNRTKRVFAEKEVTFLSRLIA